MRVRAIHLFVGLMGALATACVLLLPWDNLSALPRTHIIGIIALTGLGLLSESLAVTFTVARNRGNSSITFLPLLACVLLFGPAAAVLLMGVSGGIAEFLIRRKEAIRAFFNLSQYVTSTTIAGMAYAAAGGVAWVDLVTTPAGDFDLQIWPFAAFGLVFLGLNHGSVSLAVALDQALPFRRVWRQMAGPSGTNLLYDLLIGPIAIAVAFLYVELGAAGLVLVLLPLLFIRYSYLTNLRLQHANRSLLKALVKAIETRDPYTSGHSLRVSALARRIGEGCGLSGRRLEEIETAALLHDVGKIEAVYTEILRKPGDLSVEERQVIESHVTKGVELLRSFSSFPKGVIDAVRGHHERVDGRGYPDQLRGDEIPLGARIIKVCDAIDAMLSDRPYRRALDIPAVKEQLREYSGIQFDPDVVAVVLDGFLLEKHAAEVAFLRGDSEGLSEIQEGVSTGVLSTP
ncbi:HD-GYP domain-containing protein [Gemmatimonadota bacterium]